MDKNLHLDTNQIVVELDPKLNAPSVPIFESKSEGSADSESANEVNPIDYRSASGETTSVKRLGKSSGGSSSMSGFSYLNG
jgi:hypothetical protein